MSDQFEPLPATHKEILEEREKNRVAAAAICEKAEKEGRGLNTEEQSAFDRHIARAQACLQAAARRQNLAAIEEGAKGSGTVSHVDDEPVRHNRVSEFEKVERSRELAFEAYCRGGRLDLSDEQREAVEALRVNPQSGEQLVGRRSDNKTFRSMQALARQGRDAESILMEMEKRSLSSVIGAQGGAVVPISFIRRLEANMLFYGGIYQAAEVIRTASGEPLKWPTFNDTANKGRRIGENVAPNNNVEPTFAEITWKAYKYTSDELLVPYELMQDSSVDLPGILAEALGERLGRILNQEMTTGTGANQPTGIVTAADVGYTTSTTTGINTDDLVQLFRSVDPAYRVNAQFMMHDNILMQLWLLKDSTGQPLFQSSYREGQPDRLLGRPVVINSDMASSATASAKTILFGQLSRYKIREVGELRFYRLIERHRENDQDAFLALVRRDGNLLKAGTTPVKVLQQAAA